MYTNELLEEKYKAQRQLSKKAQTEKADYFEVVNKEVRDLFKQNHWTMEFDERSGGHIGSGDYIKKKCKGPKNTLA